MNTRSKIGMTVALIVLIVLVLRNNDRGTDPGIEAPF
jgi:hypothetical protein